MVKDRRADPDLLLASLEKANRGKLTVFLGAAAGVGKTFTMLEAARERIAEGVDVVAGIVETHGRMETEAMLKGLPAVPPRPWEYRGKSFAELDLDALLERRPQLALVDELAHTNIPGSRHSKRYQDVEELLAAGISVYTTLNIQHLESLNDVVAQITGITVQETVPDRILENAAQIQMVDIPPEELIQRLKEGKVYVPGQAAEALRRFFRPGNITALRELALRYTAKRVDRQLESYMRIHGIDGPWPIGERVMVCISSSPFSAQLIRIGRRMADSLRTEWIAVYVDAPRRFPKGEAEKDQLAKNLRLAEELGAETVLLTGEDVAAELLDLAKRRNISQIIIGKPLHTKFWELLHGSVVDKIIRQGQGISVHVIPGHPKQIQEQTFPGRGKPFRENRPARQENPSVNLMPYVWSFLLIALLTPLVVPVKGILGTVNGAMIYLLPVLFSAAKWGPGPAFVTAALGVLTFDFFFVPPTWSFTVADLRYLISFAIFLLVGLIIGTLSTKLKDQIAHSRQGQARVAALYALSREIAAVGDQDTILESIARKVGETLESQVVLLLPGQDGKLELMACSNHGDEEFFNESERGVANWVYSRGQKAGRGTETLGAAAGLYLPLCTEQGILGVLGICANDTKQPFQPEQLRLLEAFAGLAALAVNRVKLTEKARAALTLAESERLRTALFNSLSHDLRTPLASIIGAVTGLLESDDVYSPAARQDLLQTIYQGALRMNRFVNNLLDMARLESGMLKLKKEWCDIEEIIGVAVHRLGEGINSRPVKVDIEAGLPLVQADFVLIEQVLVNLLDNALKYSEAGSELSISAYQGDGLFEIAVANRGPSISVEDLGRIFDKFYRLKSPQQASGTGLGLAICKGLIEAHGGNIWAENNPGGGVIIKFVLPLGDESPGQIPGLCEGGEDGN